LKDKINELEINSKHKNIRDLYRGITEFKKGYQPKTNLVKNEKGDLLADPQKMLTRWNNYFCQLLNLQGADGIKHTEIHTAEPFVPEPSAAEVKVAIRKFKSYKVPGSDQIPAELIQAGGKYCILSYTNLLCLSGTRKNCLTSGKSQLSYLFTKKDGKTDSSNYRGISLLSTSYKILSNILLPRLIPYVDDIIGDHECGF
jgi:hypothetical protein